MRRSPGLAFCSLRGLILRIFWLPSTWMTSNPYYVLPCHMHDKQILGTFHGWLTAKYLMLFYPRWSLVFFSIVITTISVSWVQLGILERSGLYPLIVFRLIFNKTKLVRASLFSFLIYMPYKLPVLLSCVNHLSGLFWTVCSSGTNCSVPFGLFDIFVLALQKTISHSCFLIQYRHTPTSYDI